MHLVSRKNKLIVIQTIFVENLSAVLVFASSQEENVILQPLCWCWWVLRRDFLRTWRWKGQIGHFEEKSLNIGCYPGTGNLGSDCKAASRQKYFTTGPCQFFFFFFWGLVISVFLIYIYSFSSFLFGFISLVSLQFFCLLYWIEMKNEMYKTLEENSVSVPHSEAWQ